MSKSNKQTALRVVFSFDEYAGSSGRYAYVKARFWEFHPDAADDPYGSWGRLYGHPLEDFAASAQGSPSSISESREPQWYAHRIGIEGDAGDIATVGQMEKALPALRKVMRRMDASAGDRQFGSESTRLALWLYHLAAALGADYVQVATAPVSQNGAQHYPVKSPGLALALQDHAENVLRKTVR